MGHVGLLQEFLGNCWAPFKGDIYVYIISYRFLEPWEGSQGNPIRLIRDYQAVLGLMRPYLYLDAPTTLNSESYGPYLVALGIYLRVVAGCWYIRNHNDSVGWRPCI